MFHWLDPDLRQKMAAMLDAPLPRGRERLAYRRPPCFLDRGEVDGRSHVVFACYYPYLNSIKKSVMLRRGGAYYTTLLACCIREDMQILDYFDEAYEVETYSELQALLAGARPQALNVTIQPSGLAALALDVLPEKVRLIIDVYDSHYFMSRDSETPDSRLERAVLQRAHAWTHKMPPAAVRQMAAAWDLQTPEVQTLTLPWSEFFTSCNPPPGPPWRLVYAGGIMPARIAEKNGHAHMIIDPIVTGTAGADIELSVWVHQNARNMFWEDQQRYYDLARQYSHFHFRSGVPFQRLAGEIAGFHYGLLYDNMALSSYRPEAFWYNIPTKFYSYLEAGLPVLVYDAFRHISDIVREHNLGLVYALDRIADLPALLRGADYEAMKKAVIRFRQSHELRTTFPQLERLYE